MEIRAFPITNESEFRRLVKDGAEVELVCTKAPTPEEPLQGEWLFLLLLGEETPVRMVLVTIKSRHRVFLRYTGVVSFAAHTLELQSACIPLVTGGTCRGMFHRDRVPVASGGDPIQSSAGNGS